MNRKYLALIGVIIALSIIITAFLFQSFSVNNAANATAKADSFEMQYLSGSQITLSNLNIYNNTIKAEYQYELSNFTKVSELTFLNDLSGANTANTVIRIENTFYLQLYRGGVQYSPSYSPILYSSTFSLPTPIGFLGNAEEASITNVVFNSNTQVTVTVQNIGSTNVTIVTATIDGNTAPMNPLTLIINEGTTGTVTLTSATAFVNSAQYTINLTTAKGNTLSYTATYSGT